MLQHSHHEQDAPAISGAGAFGWVYFGVQTHRAQQETQHVTHHHQQDHWAHGQRHFPSGNAWTHFAVNLWLIDDTCVDIQASYLILSMSLRLGMDLSISLCTWSRLADTSARDDNGISSSTLEICVVMSFKSFLLSKTHTHTFLF